MPARSGCDFLFKKVFEASDDGKYVDYPVNSPKKPWKDPPCLMGKSTISTGPWLQ